MEEYMGVIKMFAGNFAPQGWLFCYGQLLSINSYKALFAILGTYYGGDGITTFKLPDLGGRVPVGAGYGHGLSIREIGQKGGAETVTLTPAQMPEHRHTYHGVSGNREKPSPANNFLGTAAGPFYGEKNIGDSLISMHDEVISTAGQSQAHENMQPYTVINYIICVQGIFPSRD